MGTNVCARLRGAREGARLRSPLCLTVGGVELHLMPGGWVRALGDESEAPREFCDLAACLASLGIGRTATKGGA